MYQLVHFNRAKQELALATKIDEVKEIRDRAEALRVYAKQAGETLEMQNQCAEIKIRAERRAGELLREQEKHPPGPEKKDQSHDVTDPPKLSDIGISKMQSSRWQAIASIPEEKFEEHITTVKDSGEELTSVGLYRLAQKLTRQENQISQKVTSLPKGKFEVIVIDPPWPYGTEYDPKTRRIASPYPEMSIEKIREIKIPASDNCVLWLWTTHKFLSEAFKLLKDWEFEYKLTLVWNKEKMGIGSWLRCQVEFCLLGIKGNPEWNLTNERDIISETRREHSRKPNKFYQMVEKLCKGRKLDMFSREKRDGWQVWGNEPNKF